MDIKSDKKANYDKIFNFYSKIYIESSGAISREWQTFWTIFILFLTSVLVITGFAIINQNLVLVSAIPLIHAGWFNGLLIKFLDCDRREKYGRYLEIKISKIIKVFYPSADKFKIDRFSTFDPKLIGAKEKPGLTDFQNPIQGFYLAFYAFPVAIYLAVLGYMGYLTNLIYGESKFINGNFFFFMLLIIVYIGLEVFIIYRFFRAWNCANKEFDSIKQKLN